MISPTSTQRVALKKQVLNYFFLLAELGKIVQDLFILERELF